MITPPVAVDGSLESWVQGTYMPLNSFVSLSADPGYQRDHTGRRMRLFADAYGLSQAPRQQLVPTLAGRASAMRTFLAQRASGTHPWARLRRKATATPGEPVPNTSAARGNVAARISRIKSDIH